MNRPNAIYFQGVYIGSQTHNRVKEKWSNSHKRINKFLKQRDISYYIECNLKYGNTPEIISYLLKERFHVNVSHETLYTYIYSSPKGLKRYLLRRKDGRLPKKKARLFYKGTVENINGLIRRFFQKGTDFDKISEEQIAYVEDWINNRPMKILHYMTPKQKLQYLGVAIAS